MNTGDVEKRNVAQIVGVYDTAVGIWPLLSMTSFSSATGLTNHLNVVRFLGFAWSGLGLALLAMHNKPKVVNILGVMSTLAGGSLALTQIALVATKAIPPIFLLQSIAELTIGFTWMKTLRRVNLSNSKSRAKFHPNSVAR